MIDDTLLFTRILRQTAHEWLLDAPRSKTGTVAVVSLGPASLQWFTARQRWTMSIIIQHVWDPVPLVLMIPQEPAVRTAGRREPRCALPLTGYLYTAYDPRDKTAAAGTLSSAQDDGAIFYPAVVRDASPSGVRCGTPAPVTPNQRLTALWHLAYEPPLMGRMQVLALRPPNPPDRDQAGQDVILLWDPMLTGPDLTRWIRYLTESTGPIGTPLPHPLSNGQRRD